MDKLFYLDTSIWLDIFEDRDEAKFPKSQIARALLSKIIKEDDRILCSDMNLAELQDLGYTEYEFNELIKPFEQAIIFVDTEEKVIGRAKDISQKRNIPHLDTIHSIIARDNRAILITWDKHFQQLRDIVEPHTPREFI
ncbi:MAG: PIN domain-containing protein [Nanoarchaeota archaeon]